ncbi:nucleoside phosphorylase domain-containing protein [Sparassis latifolia]
MASKGAPPEDSKRSDVMREEDASWICCGRVAEDRDELWGQLKHKSSPQELCETLTFTQCASGGHAPVTDIDFKKKQSTVAGNKGALAFSLLGPGNDVPVVAMLGQMSPVVYPVPVRIMARLGRTIRALNHDIPVGTIVVVHDHLAIANMTGPLNALFGPLISPDQPRFLPLSDAYSPALRRLAFLAAHPLHLPESALAGGHTPAEGRFLRAAGADVVGMSTVPEVLVLSLFTNTVFIPDRYCSIKEEVRAELEGKRIETPESEVASHEEVLAVGKEKAEVMKGFVARVIELIPSD